MRVEVSAKGTTLTAGELREALVGVADAAPVYVNSDYYIFGAVGEDLSLNLAIEEQANYMDD